MEDVVAFAHRRRVRVLVDAEHSYFQPAIDNAVLHMQRKYNKVRWAFGLEMCVFGRARHSLTSAFLNPPPTQEFALVYNTYQCYLRDSVDRVNMDVARSQHEGWVRRPDAGRRLPLYLMAEDCPSW
jgi:proline dehydrogenase